MDVSSCAKMRPMTASPTVQAGTSVLVTGASSGIGAATAVALGARGARVGIVARRSDRLHDVRDATLAAGAASCEVWVTDLGDLDAAVATVIDADDRFGGLDVLINNAAIPRRVSVVDLTADQLDETMRVNFTSPVRMIQALLPRLIQRGSGTVVNVCSMGGRLGIKGEAAYCASKFALAGWTEAMAIDLWSTGITVRLVHPGPIDTEIWNQPGNAPADYDGALEPPSTVAEGIIAAVESDHFEHYVPDLSSIAEFKTSQIDVYLQAVAEQ